MSIKKLYPLSNPQQGMWYTEKIYPGTGIANLVGSMRLKENLDFDLLVKAVKFVWQDNEALRLRIVEDIRGSWQYVKEYEDQEVPFLDFSDKGGWEGFVDWVENDSHLPFNGTESPLCSLIMFKIGPGDGGVVMKAHHSIVDNWAMVLTSNQVNNYYKQMLDGVERPQPYTHPYTDFIQTQLNYEMTEQYEKNKLFWAKKFSDIPENSSLKPNRKNYLSCEASRKTYMVPTDLTSQINEYCSAMGISGFVFFLSILCIYMYRVTGKEDMVIGAPLANRPTMKDKLTVGMMIEMLPVRISIDPDLNFNEFARHVVNDWREMRAHQHPYQLILRDIRDRLKLSANLYEIMLNFQIAHLDPTALFDIHIFFHGSMAESMRIHFNDWGNLGQFEVFIDYLTELFSGDEIDNVYNQLMNLANDTLLNPDKKLYELDYLSPDEKNDLIYGWNNTEVDYPRNKTVVELFEEQVSKNPDNTALIYEKQKLTYSQLNQAANQVARKLRLQGVGPESIVGLLMERSSEMIIAMLAVLKAGGAYLPLDSNYPRERIEFVLEDSQASLVITKHRNPELGSRYPHVTWDELLANDEDGSNLPHQNTPSNAAYVIYTSGSTGKPKGVIIEHHSVVNFFTAMEQQIDLQDKKVLVLTNPAFDIFVFETLLPLVKGETLVIANQEQQLIPVALADLIRQHKVNILQCTPSRMQMLLSDNHFAPALKTITDIVLGGEPFPETLLQKIKSICSARIFNGYGPTEATVYATFKDVTRDDHITIGKPVSNTRVYILDDKKQPVAVDVAGQLFIAGEGLARGYLYRPELTEERFLPDPFYPGQRMYHTGDLAKWSMDGNLDFLGRIDNQIKIRGFRIELGEIESVLESHPQIDQAVVIDKADRDGLKYLSAYMVAKGTPSTQDVRRYLMQRLPDYMVPSSFVFLQTMPLNPNGKICRKTLANMQSERRSQPTAYVGPRNEVDEILVETWGDIFSTSRISINDSFFDLGGDSFKIVKILVALMPYNWDLTARDFYKYQTIRSLSDKIRGITEEGDWERHLQPDNEHVYETHDTNHIQLSSERVACDHILLTGGTGYLGVHLVKDLIEHTQANIYCLVRGVNEADAYNRLLKALNIYFPGELDMYLGNRIHVLLGDINENLLGLSVGHYHSLGTTIDAVIHAAAKVRHYGGYREFERVNVLGTRNVIAFCKTYRKKLHYISTTSVSGKYLVVQNLGQIVFTENDFFVGQHYYENVYVRSKFEAESLIYTAISQGLNATIYRIGMLSGRYSDGRFQFNIEDNALYNRFRAIINLGSIPAPFANHEFEYTPVDYCSHAIVLLLGIKEGDRKVFHLYNPKVSSLMQFLEASETCGYQVKVMESTVFEKDVKDRLEDPITRDSLTGIINDINVHNSIGLQSSPELSCQISMDYLSQLGFEWPDIDNEYLIKLIRYMESVGFIVHRTAQSPLFLD